MHSLIHSSFIQGTFIEHFLALGTLLHNGPTALNNPDKHPCPPEDYLLVGEDLS